MRSISEWQGKNDDSKPPPLVRARIFTAHDGVCHISKRKIRPGEKWELEHIIAICNGGSNSESNLAPALVEPHKTKTKLDRKLKSKTDRMRKMNLGIKKKSSFRGWRKMNGDIVRSQ